MLKKLMKYDLRALMPWYLMMGTVLLCTAGLSRLFEYLRDALDTNLLDFLYAAVVGIFTLACYASLLLTSILPAVRYYQNLIGDEGYLTFTLPATKTQVYFSKVISSALLSVLLYLFLGASLLAAYCTSAQGWESFSAMLDTAWNLFVESFSVGQMLWAGGLALLGIPLLLSSGQTHYFLCLNLGQLSKKHKLLYSFLSFCALGIGTGIATGLLSLTSLLCLDADGVTAALILLSVYVGFYVILYLVETLVSLHLLKKHLNLV